MRKASRLLLCGALMAALLPAAVVPAVRASAWDANQAPIAELIAQTEAANNAGDVGAWVELFAEDAVYMAPGAPAVTTREGLVEVATAGFRHQAAIEIEPVEIRTAGDWAFSRSHVSGTVTLERSGEVVPIDMKQVVIYERDEHGAWKIARLIGNRNGE